ncbi:galactose-1-phosphate uridylyltransferase [Leucothrix arctica]|uniref:Galactose-1-phosphate uridylyltransferase n=1 Tax=Leucothrix arctica TaxID=1481894 RepID=A0A317CE71_9GAMM|nr:galactose-1-phosphate uridylyltransferase [Leucothrix arctica]PWQ96985.1 galactose-1-phosphate uridylyltransferase [Leucothrix arctica]
MTNVITDQGNWERRWHPLLSQWVVVAARTGNRPWNGATVGEESDAVVTSAHDKSCHLCAGNTRSNGEINPDYTGPWAFNNDYASFAPDAPSFENENNNNPLHRRDSNQGHCRVLCWTERHDQTLASISTDNMLAVGQLWQNEYNTLSQDPEISQVLIFENKGQEIGVSNPHPHGQIYATSFVGDSFERARKAQAEWARDNSSVMLLDLIAREEYQYSLKVSETDHFMAIVPYFARFAYECWIIPKAAAKHIGDMSDAQRDDLALLYQKMAKTYNVLFQRESPNISLMYNAPCDTHQDNQHWQFHFVMQPPLREPDKLKYLAGFESGTANIVNPVQPEAAAQRLREAFKSAETNT